MRSSTAYQLAAAEGATHVGLLILVYDAIASDLFRAGQGVRSKNIGQRTSAIKHALSLLGHLESWLETMDDSRLASSLEQFYSMLRARMLQLQAEPSAHGFDDLAQVVLDTRATWQKKEQQMRVPVAGAGGPAHEASLNRVSFRA